MKVEFHSKFNKDIKAIKKAEVKQSIEQTILTVEEAPSMNDVPNLLKMKGAENAYRIRIGVYRIGLIKDGDTLVFIRVLHRRDIYRYFP